MLLGVNSIWMQVRPMGLQLLHHCHHGKVEIMTPAVLRLWQTQSACPPNTKRF
jgi:hypothetical protein